MARSTAQGASFARWQISPSGSTQAGQEFLTALGWYRERNLAVAIDFAGAVSKAAEVVGAAPQRWPAYFGEFRRYTLHRFPFSIVYQEMISEVVVFAVAHASRRPGYWIKRR